jgi:mannose-6-phosphate isomerase-like protein (cupin superfamily)
MGFFSSGVQIATGKIRMRITRLYSGTDSASHFEDLEVPFESREYFGLFTLPEMAKAVFFREIPPGWVYSWHNVVCREYVIMIEGEAEIEVGSGEKRKFGRGDILLAEDLTGHGHRTRVLGKKVWRQVFVTLP